MHRILIIVLLLGSPAAGWCQDQRLKVEGEWDGKTFVVDRVRQRNASKDVRKIRIAGAVANISTVNRAVQIGPVRLRWQAREDALFATLQPGDAVSIDALLNERGHFVVARVEQTQLDSAESIELIGALTDFSSDDDWTDLYLAGIPARTPKRLFSNGRLRLQRLDDRRPDDQFTTTIGGVRTTVGGEFGLKADADGERDLDEDTTDGEFESAAQLQVEAFFEFSDGVYGFAELKAEQSVEYDDSFDRTASTFEFKRGELWLLVDQPLGLPVAIQIGRQNFAEEREWWWDTDLDAIRVFVSSPNFQFEIAIAQELGREVLGGDRGDAEDLDVTRLLATGRLRLNSRLTLAAYLLSQNDHSSSFAVNEVIAMNQEDEDDADLSWVGARLFGRADPFVWLEAEYWFDIAHVSGKETRYDFDDFNAGELIVETVVEQDRSGTGFDIGATMSFPETGIFRFSDFALTVGYAGGSGGSDANGTFRQTGLNDNNNKFTGVDRFRYYGELTRPDLENIRISTLAVGFRLGEDSSVEIIHHNYRQDRTSTTHPLRLDTDANGRATNLGDEFDLVIGIEKWKHFEFEAVGAVFVPGNAFDERDAGWFVALKLDYNF